MTKRMLIDATHAEETRVVVLDGNRLEDFDVETSTKRQLKGNIYLAKVVRVEPSLQAAFVEYGGNRHGFLAFSEIHPDYYQIPVADRQRLLEMQAEDARREEEEEDLEIALSQATESKRTAHRESRAPRQASHAGNSEQPVEDWARPSLPLLIARDVMIAPLDLEAAEGSSSVTSEAPGPEAPEAEARDAEAPDAEVPGAETPDAEIWANPGVPPLLAAPAAEPVASRPEATEASRGSDDERDSYDDDSFDPNGDQIEMQPPPEIVGGQDQDVGDDQRERRLPPRFLRN
jgi:ribonuclease E